MKIRGFVEHFFKQRGKQRVVDQRSGEPDTLVEAYEMWAGVSVNAAPLCFEYRAEEGAGRTLAVGASNVESARELVLRVAEARAKLGDAFEAEDIAPRRERGEAVELGLYGGVGGLGVVGHSCGAFASPSPSGEGLGWGPAALRKPHPLRLASKLASLVALP